MDGHNLFNINTITAAPFIVPETSDLEDTLKRMLARAPGGFKRSDIKGPPVSTFWNVDVRQRYLSRLADSRLTILTVERDETGGIRRAAHGHRGGGQHGVP